MKENCEPFKIGEGIFMWSAPERRLSRYGVFFMADSDVDNTISYEPYFDYEMAKAFVGLNVKLYCKVLVNRKSNHAGDRLLEIYPSKPDIGEVVELGVGTCYLEADRFAPGGFAIGLKPTDNREKLWIDPRKFYRLHEQTVELFLVPTDEPETHDPTPFIKQISDEGVAISNGDGTVQVYGSITKDDDNLTISPIIEKIVQEEDGGMFMVIPPTGMGNAGQVFGLKKKQ